MNLPHFGICDSGQLADRETPAGMLQETALIMLCLDLQSTQKNGDYPTIYIYIYISIYVYTYIYIVHTHVYIYIYISEIVSEGHDFGHVEIHAVARVKVPGGRRTSTKAHAAIHDDVGAF